MVNIIPNVSKTLELLWQDKLEVFRKGLGNKKPSGASTLGYQSLKSEIKCKLSTNGKGGEPNITDTGNRIEYDQLIICAYNTDVILGDKLVVTKSITGEKITLYAGKPFSYKNSLQVPCREYKNG